MVKVREILVAGALVLALAGCSPTQEVWIQRGMAGLSLARENQTAWYVAAVKQLDKDRVGSIDAAFADTREALVGGVRVSASQPTTRPLDVEWLGTQEKALILTMSLYDQKKADLDEKYQVAMRNLDSTEECFKNIQRLNKVWAQSDAALSAQIDRLTILVGELQKEKGK